MHYGADPEIYKRAALLRKNMTPSEQKLWNYLKNHESIGFKFRRQHPINHYIVDFYCHSLKLIIEVDGGIHQNEDQLIKDILREEDLKSLGLSIIRFSNTQIELFFEEVIAAITIAINEE